MDDLFLDRLKSAKKTCEITYELKEKQVECLKNVVQGIDTIALLPTGK